MMSRTFLIGLSAAAALSASASASVITGVSVNDGGTYTVQMGGLMDGATAFFDSSDFSWTGVPSFLSGADYIQTANGDNSNSDLEVTVELSQPAVLYVFHSDGVDDPDWLTSDFMDTGDDITLSGGNSDTTYSIYSREFDGSGSANYTLLDNDPNTTNSERMYGIAAVVPTPGSVALLAAAGVFGVRRRR